MVQSLIPCWRPLCGRSGFAHAGNGDVGRFSAVVRRVLQYFAESTRVLCGKYFSAVRRAHARPRRRDGRKGAGVRNTGTSNNGKTHGHGT